MTTLRIILNNHLSHNISSLNGVTKNDIILFIEAKDQYTKPKHHQKKIAFLLSAMRCFAYELQQKSWQVVYVKLNDATNSGNLCLEITKAYQKFNCQKAIITMPSNYQLKEDLEKLTINLDILEDTSFLATRKFFQNWAENKKQPRMEFFYREMRVKHRILMQNNKPLGGKWNYDQENRKFPKHQINLPPLPKIPLNNITQEVLELTKEHFHDHFGDLLPFDFATTRKDALILLHDFINNRLAFFGDYQDAMLIDEPYLYHSILSHYLNVGLLNPLECIKLAEEFLHKNPQSLNAVEGFIRQILGWREYVNGIYWLKMPQYAKENFLQAHNKLPQFYWSGNTKLNCLASCVKQTKKYAYAHHIQRLMVLGNFALLAGVEPKELNDWYLLVYADAWQWVEMPNVSGMVLFADGGYLASKPYIASGSYINKMSNYCQKCSYNLQEKTGKTACPFNYLYWNFLLKHQHKLKHNPRLSIAYSQLNKMNTSQQKQITTDSDDFLKNLP